MPPTEKLSATQVAALEHCKSAEDLFAAQQRANKEHYPVGLASGTARAHFAARTPIEFAERDKLCATVVQYERQLNNDACIIADSLVATFLTTLHSPSLG